MTGKLSIKVLWLIAMLVLTTSAFAQRVAVLNFNAGSGVTQMEVDGLSSIFNTYFAPKGAEIVERTSVDKILQEQKFQNSRFTNTDMVALGEMLNVSLIVVGDINVVMEQYNVDVRVVNVQTGTTVAKDGTSFSTGGSYRDMMKELGERLSKSLELEIEKFQITSDRNSNGNNNDNNGKASVLPKNMTTKITEDNSKRERTDVVVLEGFLKLYPEDLGEFSSEPSWLIKLINQQERYGYNSWRLPTQEELDFIRSNGYLSGNKYMTKEDPSGVLMLVTTEKQKKQKVDLIVQFSIRDMLCSHLGFTSNILVLDEVFDGLDAIGCQKVLDVISAITDIKNIFIVTHRKDLSIPTDKEIVVVKSCNGISEIR